MSSSGSYVLLQFGSDPCSLRFEDLECRLACTMTVVDEAANLVLKLTREAPWAQQHPDILGPSSSFFYFGPSRSPGYIWYGNVLNQTMADCRKQKSNNSSSRCFKAINGKEYKWKISPQRLECVDGKGAILAVWEAAQPEDEYEARLTIKHAGLALVTEILTTLVLNRLAHTWSW